MTKKDSGSTASNNVMEAGDRTEIEAGRTLEPLENVVQTRIGREVVKKKIFEAGKN
jgi:hypothetical protein